MYCLENLSQDVSILHRACGQCQGATENEKWLEITVIIASFSKLKKKKKKGKNPLIWLFDLYKVGWRISPSNSSAASCKPSV